MLKYLTLLGLLLPMFAAFAQYPVALNGRVLDTENNVLAGASVVLLPGNHGTTSDENGYFVFKNLEKGKYTLMVSFIGFKTFEETLVLANDQKKEVVLTAAPLDLQEVLVRDNYADVKKREESLNVEVVHNDFLEQNRGGSLMQSLERLPGVTTIDIGSGQSKPVIRGLSFNRVVVVENSIKHEAQQWGADHGLEIDQYAVNNVEVIKGPASLMYGSDAIGGVIDMKNRTVPVNNTWGGTLDLTGKTNNDLLGVSMNLFGRKKWFYADVRGTYIDYADYKVPTDSVDIYSYRAALYNNNLRNTAGYEKNLHVQLGVVTSRFQNRLYVSTVNSKSGFFANAHGLEPRSVDTELHDKSSRDINYPYQKVNHFKLINTSEYQWLDAKLELDLGFQRNFRQEWSEYVSHGYMPAVFPDTMDFNGDLEREFDKHVYSGNMKFSKQLPGQTQLVAGVSSEFQENRIDGRGFIIPAYEQLRMGGFAFAKHRFSEKSLLQLGLRFDYGNIDVSEYYDWFTSPVENDGETTQEYLQRAEDLHRSFSSFSWSVGYNFMPESWVFKANVGRSFRMPIAKELAANGVNYHRFSYEVGNASLSPEVAYQLDLGIEYQTQRFVAGATPFVNYFTNYIYLNPSSDYDRLYGNGNQIYYYTESEVLRYGGEIHAHYEVLPQLQLGILGEYVYSEQKSGEKKGFTLPFSPPESAIFNVKYHHLKLGAVKNAYVSLDYRVTAAQNDVVPPEEPTDGYQLLNLALGGDLYFGQQKVKLAMQVQNLFDTKYFNHTSYYRLINVPEPGRNFIVNVSIPFSGKI